MRGLRWFVQGYDVFVSYAHLDATAYVEKLVVQLSQRRLACFVDQYVAHVSAEIPTDILEALSLSSMLVVVGTPAAVSSVAILEEVRSFKKNHPGNPIVGISVDGALPHAGPLADELRGPPYVLETANALGAGPSLDVIARIQSSIDFLKWTTRRRLIAAAVAVVVLALTYGGSVYRTRTWAECLADASVNELEHDPVAAIKLADRPLSVTSSVNAEDALRRALMASGAQRRLEHPGEVEKPVYKKVLYLGNGDTIATMTPHSVRLWDASSGKSIGEALTIADELHAIASNGDALMIATGDHGIQEWTFDGGHWTSSGTPLQEKAIVLDLTNGTRAGIVSGDSRGNAQLWHSSAGALAAGPPFAHHGDPLPEDPDRPPELSLQHVAIDPSEDRLATASSNLVFVWNVRTRAREVVFHPDLYVRALAFSPTEDTLLTAGEGEIDLWDLASKRHDAQLDVGEDTVLCAAFSPDGKLIAAGTKDGAIILWGRIHETWRPLKTFHGHRDQVNDLHFSRDGEHIVSASDDATVRLWTVHSLLDENIMGHASAVDVTRVSPNGRYLVTGTDNGRIQVVELGLEAPVLQPPQKDSAIAVIAFADDSTVFASTSSREVFIDALPSSSRECNGSIEAEHSPGGVVAGVALSEKAHRLLTVSPEGVEIRDASAYSNPVTLDAPMPIVGATFAHGGKDVVTASASGVRLWRNPTTVDSPSTALPQPTDAGPLSAAAWSCDAATIVTAYESTAYVLGLDSGTMGPPLQHSAPITSLAVSCDGSVVVGIADAQVRVWREAKVKDAKVKMKVGNLDERSTVRAVAISSDGRFLATGTRDGSITVWDLKRMRQIVRLIDGDPTTTTDVGAVRSLAFGPDDAVLVAGVSDGKAYVFPRVRFLPLRDLRREARRDPEVRADRSPASDPCLWHPWVKVEQFIDRVRNSLTGANRNA
jgi:WD40 repeat protein